MYLFHFNFLDVDECSVGNHTCHPTAECINTEGSFLCQCDENNNSSSPCSTGN